MSAQPVFPDQLNIASRFPKIPLQLVQKTTNATNVASNSKGVVQIPLNATYYATFLRFLTGAGAECTKAQIEAEISSLNVEINGRQHWALMTPAQLNMLTDFYCTEKGLTSGAGYLFFNWAGYNSYQNPGDITQTALGTADLNSFNINLNFGTLANIASVEAYHLVTNEYRPMGPNIQIERRTETHSAANSYDEIEFLKEPGFGYKAIHINQGSGVIQRVVFDRDKQLLRDDIPVTLSNFKLRAKGRAPQTGWAHIDFADDKELTNFLYTGNPADSRSISKILMAKPYFTTAPGAYDILIEKVIGFKV